MNYPKLVSGTIYKQVLNPVVGGPLLLEQLGVVTSRGGSIGVYHALLQSNWELRNSDYSFFPLSPHFGVQFPRASLMSLTWADGKGRPTS